MPLYAAYIIIVWPLRAQVSTQNLVDPCAFNDTLPGHATIGLSLLLEPSFDAGYIPTTETTATLRSGEVITCSEMPLTGYGRIMQCPSSWVHVSSVSISVSLPPGILYVYPGQGTLPLGFEYWDVYALGGDVPLFPGSHVVGVISWTERQLISPLSWGSVSRKTVWTPEIAGLQTKPFGDTPDSNLTTLTLFQPTAFATKVLQDTVDVTALSGVATFGGFWTFVNGTARQRPLFALGVVHIFQRRSLVRQWNEDFPGIHTEGGQPGSESAGIVAFIRQRLVDLGEDPLSIADEPAREHDIEAQTQGSELEPEGRGEYNVRESGDEDDAAAIEIRAAKAEVESPHRGYLLDEIPLLDMDLGLER